MTTHRRKYFNLSDQNIEVMGHPPCDLDWASNDFLCSRRSKPCFEDTFIGMTKSTRNIGLTVCKSGSTIMELKTIRPFFMKF